VIDADEPDAAQRGVIAASGLGLPALDALRQPR
jgi:hypothetical protein